MTRPLIGLIRVYQRWLSPLFPPSCRYWPTCSEYAVAALAAHGFWRGSWLALWRVLRCNPFSAGGHDPVVPPSKPVPFVEDTAAGAAAAPRDGRGA